jgi:hypothetical protein
MSKQRVFIVFHHEQDIAYVREVYGTMPQAEAQRTAMEEIHMSGGMSMKVAHTERCCQVEQRYIEDA